MLAVAGSAGVDGGDPADLVRPQAIKKSMIALSFLRLIACDSSRAIRPKAKWGYYGYFYSPQYPRALWEAMDALYPQLYLLRGTYVSSKSTPLFMASVVQKRPAFVLFLHF